MSKDAIRITDATRGYLHAFDQWLANPSATNRQHRASCLARMVDGAPPTTSALCKSCSREFERRTGRGRPRLHCERCRRVRRAA